jgi:DNA-binding transcriptional LysR family regulator
MSLLHKNLVAFAAIAAHESVHGAAKALFLTQTAVTQRLKSLEESIGVSLFERSRRGMLLTSEGKEMLRYCQMLQLLSQEMLERLSGSQANISINVAIAGPTSLMYSRVTPAIIPVMKNFPQLLIEFMYRDDASPIEFLRRGRVQLAIIPITHCAKEMESKLLEPETYVLVGTPRWKDRALKDILEKEKIIDFNSNDEMTFNYLKYHGLLNRHPYDRHFANHPEAIAQLVSNGVGYSVLEKSFAESFIKSKKLILLNHGKTYINEMALVWFARPQMPEYFTSLIDSIA